MSWSNFVLELVRTLRWPATVIIIAFLLRPAVKSAVDSWLKRLR